MDFRVLSCPEGGNYLLQVPGTSDILKGEHSAKRPPNYGFPAHHIKDKPRGCVCIRQK